MANACQITGFLLRRTRRAPSLQSGIKNYEVERDLRARFLLRRTGWTYVSPLNGSIQCRGKKPFRFVAGLAGVIEPFGDCVDFRKNNSARTGRTVPDAGCAPDTVVRISDRGSFGHADIVRRTVYAALSAMYAQCRIGSARRAGRLHFRLVGALSGYWRSLKLLGGFDVPEQFSNLFTERFSEENIFCIGTVMSNRMIDRRERVFSNKGSGSDYFEPLMGATVAKFTQGIIISPVAENSDGNRRRFVSPQIFQPPGRQPGNPSCIDGSSDDKQVIVAGILPGRWRYAQGDVQFLWTLCNSAGDGLNHHACSFSRREEDGMDVLKVHRAILVFQAGFAKNIRRCTVSIEDLQRIRTVFRRLRSVTSSGL